MDVTLNDVMDVSPHYVYIYYCVMAVTLHNVISQYVMAVTYHFQITVRLSHKIIYICI